jgi:hypothetical protein
MKFEWQESRNPAGQPRGNFKSITPEFRADELPEFTILTGKNGVGKSHFFTAIKNGALATEGIAAADVAVFDWTNFRATGGKPVVAFNDVDQFWENLCKAKTEQLASLTKTTNLSEHEVANAIETRWPIHPWESGIDSAEKNLRNELHWFCIRTVSSATNDQRSLSSSFAHLETDIGRKKAARDNGD